jgi:hypothetical protein
VQDWLRPWLRCSLTLAASHHYVRSLCLRGRADFFASDKKNFLEKLHFTKSTLFKDSAPTLHLKSSTKTKARRKSWKKNSSGPTFLPLEFFSRFFGKR